jgi:thymidylate synthase (FAD)
MEGSEDYYFKLLKNGAKPEHARSVLPNSLKTEVVMTCNMREWMHVLKLRCSKAAHPQMRALMQRFLTELKERVPVIFDGIRRL